MSRSSNSSETDLATSAPRQAGRSRQQPGQACQECRRRKQRCDRGQPQCKNCEESGIVCTVDKTHVPRGPKRGHLQSLQTKIGELAPPPLHQLLKQGHPNATIATLESRLQEQQNVRSAAEPPPPSATIPLDRPLTAPMASDVNVPSSTTSMFEFEPSLHSLFDQPVGLATPASSVSSISTTVLDRLIKTDLDQLYFERVHVLAPMIHKRRYFTWAHAADKTESQSCLQYAMWTLAASLSTQFHTVRDSLYETTRQLLMRNDSYSRGMDTVRIEHVQARILMAIYEFMRSSYQSAWMTAGYCFRLVQLMRLYEVDAVGDSTTLPEPDTWIMTEEKRRTFWMAYLLDRFASLSDGWPLTLSEHVILTRLPAPENNFQTDRPLDTGFLSQAVADNGAAPTNCPLVELIILATICGRVVSHRQSSSVERVYGDSSHGFWKRHEWLDSLLSARIQVLARDYPSPLVCVDPVLLFTEMIAQTMVISLRDIIQSSPSDSGEYATRSELYDRRAFAAAQEIAILVKAMVQLSCFKVHPFTPIALLKCAEFLARQPPSLDPRPTESLKDILEAVGELKNVNNLAQRSYAPVDRHQGHR